MSKLLNETGTLAFTECCLRVIRASQAQKTPTAMIHYAASYAAAGRHMHDRSAIRVQALYILNNLQGWRGEEARLVKAQLREFAR